MFRYNGEEFDGLFELTGQESGIVIYGESVLVVNWMVECRDGWLPVLSSIGTVMEWPEDKPLEVTSFERIDDIRDMLPGTISADGDEVIAVDMDIVYDYYNDLAALWGYEVGNATVIRDDDANLLPTEGKVYRIERDDDTAIVIAPDGWN